MNKRQRRVTIGYEELERLLRLQEGIDIVRVEDRLSTVTLVVSSPIFDEARVSGQRKTLASVQKPQDEPLISADVHKQIVKDRISSCFRINGSLLLNVGAGRFTEMMTERLCQPISSREERKARLHLEVDEDEVDDDDDV